MTPKETAKKLFLEYSIVVTHKTNLDDVGAIICAKKAVNLLISAFENILEYDDSMFLVIDIDFYKNVLKELDEIKIEIHKDIKPKKCECKRATFTRTVDADFNCLCGKCGRQI